MAQTTRQRKRNDKVPLQKASASEIIAGLGITASEVRRARAAVAAAKRRPTSSALVGKRRAVSGKVQRLPKHSSR
jgi:hypothetical protein